MEFWLVQHVPAWFVGIVLIIGLPIVMLVSDAFIHRTLPHRRLGLHNDVTGVIVLVVGVAYGIVIGLCVVSLWERYSEARDTVVEDAVVVSALVPAGAVFDDQTQRRMAEAVIRYEADQVTDWNARRDQGLHTASAADLGEITGIVAALQPATEAQRAYVEHAIKTIGRAEHSRNDLAVEVDEQYMSPVMWFGVLVSTVAILVMCLFFGLDDALLRRILLTMSTAVIATNLFLVIEMNYPYYGSFAVTPGAYEEVIAHLRRGL
ncbi:DUF4239 domain-containing protein [Actinoplanes sp. NPDC023936]|uniref:bestrophin-like domain n=1 Tax=Actinoplanes sp. NPDC023936 TaxID=3154910 RepID=UPI003408F379